MNINHLLLLLSLCLFTLGPTHAAEPSSDQWADDFAVRRVRLNPQLATRVQYFSGLSLERVADSMGISPGSAEHQRTRANAWLFRRIRGRQPSKEIGKKVGGFCLTMPH